MAGIDGSQVIEYRELMSKLDLNRFKMVGDQYRPVKGVEISQIHSMRKLLDTEITELPNVDFDKLTLNQRFLSTIFAERLFDLGYMEEQPTPTLAESIASLFTNFNIQFDSADFTLDMAYVTYMFMKMGMIGLYPCKVDPAHRDLRVVGKYASGRNCPSCQSRMRPAADLVERCCEHNARRNVITSFCGEKFLADYTVRALNRARKGRGGLTGKQPNSPDYYTKTAIKRHEATILARYFQDVGLVTKKTLDINEGHLFISIYETYVAEAEKRSYDINRAFYLLLRLRKGDIVLVTCNQCGQDNIKLRSLVTPSYCAACDIELRDSTPGRRPQPEYFTLPKKMSLAG